MKTVASIAFLALAGASFAVDYTGTGGDIPDFATATGVGSITSTITSVPALSTISSIKVSGLTHTWVGDLIATVTAPNGVTVDLINRTGSTSSGGVGDSSNLGGDYTFAVGGTDLWALATNAANGTNFVIPTGSYQPFTRSAAFAYTATSYAPFAGAGAGTWSLKISDSAAGDIGAFTSWTISATPVPEPATMAALGLGVAAMVRRRKKA